MTATLPAHSSTAPRHAYVPTALRNGHQVASELLDTAPALAGVDRWTNHHAERTEWLVSDPVTGSWARVVDQLDGSRCTIEEDGPRDLWSTIVGLISMWEAAGRPTSLM